MATRRIEWIGRPSIFDDPVLTYRRIAGLVSQQELNVLREIASRSIYRVDGHTARRLGPEDPFGLSRWYQWGPHPGSYVQDVEEGDWRLIVESRSRKEFRDVTDGLPEPAPVVIPDGEIRITKEEEFSSLQDYLRAAARG